MNTGELDQLITINRPARTTDGMGGDTVALNPVVTDLWARVKPLLGRETSDHDRVEAPAMYRFKIRNRSDLLNDDQIVWDSQIYNIRVILRRGDREMYLEIDAERGVTQ